MLQSLKSVWHMFSCLTDRMFGPRVKKNGQTCITRSHADVAIWSSFSTFSPFSQPLTPLLFYYRIRSKLIFFTNSFHHSLLID